MSFSRVTEFDFSLDVDRLSSGSSCPFPSTDLSRQFRRRGLIIESNELTRSLIIVILF